ncbi:MAG: glycosyl hydrolase 108 family protein [Pseudomonadota bacterium]
MEANFAPALTAVLIHEGGYSNHPSDPGGATMKGVTQRVYNDWRRSKGLAPRDVRQLEADELTEIYKTRYWALVKAFALPAGLDYAIFDCAVNSGVAQAAKWLQRGLADMGIPGVVVDGVIGPATLEAVKRVEDVDALIAKVLHRRLDMLKVLKTWPIFGRGWARRVQECQRLGQAVAMGSVDLPMPSGWAGGKALSADAKAPPPKGVADALTGGGIVQSTLSGITDALLPVSDRSAAISTFVTVVLIAGAVAAAAGIAYRLWATRKAKALADALDIVPLAPQPEAAPAPAAA